MILGRRNIRRLALLGSSSKQNDHGVTISAEVDPVAGSSVHAVLQHPAADSFDAGQIPGSYALNDQPHPGRHPTVKSIEPVGKRAAAPVTDVLPNIDHEQLVTHMAPSCKCLVFRHDLFEIGDDLLMRDVLGNIAFVEPFVRNRGNGHVFEP